MAKVISPSNFLELFNETWLQVRESELDGVQIKNHRSYFFIALRNNSYSKNKELPKVEYFESNTPGSAFLWDWINKKTTDEDEQFYKNIITLAVVCKNKKDAFKFAGLSKFIFDKHLETAKQLIKDEYNRTTINNDFDFNSLV